MVKRTAVNDSDTLPCFMPNENMFISGFILLGEYRKPETIQQELVDNSDFYQLNKKRTPVFSNTLTTVKICFYLSMQIYDYNKETWAKIKERLAYLDETFDDAENMAVYRSTKISC